MHFFCFWNMNEDILGNVGNQRVSVPIDFHYMDKKYIGSQWELKRFGNIFQNILFCVLHRKVNHTSLE